MLKSIGAILFFTAFLLSGPTFSQRPAIIFDTDIGPDYDDVGALAILHALADNNECEILATIASNNHPNIVPVLNIVNTYFGRPNLPIAIVKGNSVQLGAWQKWDSVLVARYPHTIRSNDQAGDAVTVYRRILASQPDRSVTIVTVGFLTNMANLLRSGPDQISPLDGTELVRKKVSKLVAMAGAFPSGKEFNVEKDAAASIFTFAHWPTAVYFTGWEIGAKLFSGLPLIQSSIQHSPVKDAYAISIPKSKEDITGRKSWDQTAVLMAVRGPEKYFSLVPGKITCSPDGSNGWDANSKGHFYATEKIPFSEVEAIVNDLMQHTPRKDR